MGKPCLQRLFQCNLIIIFCNFLILWQSGSDIIQISADPKELPQAEVSSLNTVIYQFKAKAVSAIFRSYCNNAVTNYGYEIKCNADCYNKDPPDCHISEITFSGLGLSGTIDAAIGDLSEITSIKLSNNKLQGPIPEVLGNLAKLVTLDLSNNQLTGTIPASLGNLESLRYLYLQYNFLSGVIPSSLGQLSRLDQLYIHFNMLSGSIPISIGQLKNLRYLVLGENSLTGRLPKELGNLTNLINFWMPSNYFMGELPNLENLTNLRWFIVAGNQLSGQLPSYVTKWTKLEALYLQGNEFEGPFRPEYLDQMPSLEQLFISDLVGGTSEVKFPKQANLPNIYRLQLRRCFLSGPIPDYIGELSTLRHLDLSFNKLTGGIPESMRPNLIYLSLARNNLNGTIPNWIYKASGTRMDLSYNNFSSPDTPVPSDLDLNVFACCCCKDSFATKPYMLKPVNMMNEYFPGRKSKFHNLFINSGGEQTSSNGTRYDADNHTSPFYISSAQNWAYSFSGDFLAVTANSSDYTKRVPCRISNSETSLYDDARLAPVSLNYYGFGLREGRYNVTLHFAEIVYDNDAFYNILRKRLFDIYIQGERVMKNFDIREQAGGPNIAITFTFPTEVNETSDYLLDIHLYWSGKGSFADFPAYNGPLISAISVHPLFKVGDEKLAAWKIALIVVASLIVAMLLLLALAWSMGWLENKELQKKIIVGERYQNKVKTDITVLLKQIVDATKDFSDAKRIGDSGFLGSVYKAAEVSKESGITVAVKKFLPRHKGKISDMIRKDIFHGTKLEGENIVRLLDFHMGEKYQILVYEYMENESLETALFQAKVGTIPWNKRFGICLGVARGLESLHNHPSKIVHGKIKPSNVLLDKDYEPKLSDFGFASVYTDDDQFSVIRQEAKRGYLAHEYCQGDHPTFKTDIYSFGVLLIEIVAGKKNKEVIAGQETIELVNKVHQHFNENRTDIKDLVDKKFAEDHDIDEEAEEILRLAVKCTSKPSLRPEISEVVKILNNIANKKAAYEKRPAKEFSTAGEGSGSSA